MTGAEALTEADMSLDHILENADRSLDEAVELLAELIRVPSINAGEDGPGHETDVCRVLQAKLAREGIEARILESAPDRGNLVASLGSGGRPRLLLMSHLDVVPVDDADQWRFPPFAGTVADGAIHGRGAADCKGLAAAGAMALLVLARVNLPLRGTVILAAGADEETGGRYGFEWLARQHRDLIAADYALNEGGGTCFQTGERLGYILNTGEKGRLEATITLTGRGGHAAAPWAADSPLYPLATAVQRLQAYRPGVDLSHPVFDAARAMMARDLVRFLSVDFAALDRAERGIASALRGASAMTVTPTMARAGSKSNAIPATAQLTCDVRTLPGQTQADVERALADALKGLAGVQVQVRTTAEPSASDYPTPFSQAVQRATAAATGHHDLAWLPGITSGFTDSRFVRPLGATVYGFAPQAPRPELGGQEGVHGRDECLPVESLRTMLRTLVAVAWETVAKRDA
ncbi:MAG: M20/M25/M40 family metallo-hydrolase [Anaerolineae bacterium]|nr:M20/M25/M40 family metallo-hydrolase [Anaerolineae bacterium]